MLAVLAEIGCACVPEEGLSDLGSVRALPGVDVLLCDGKAWVRWASHQQEVIYALLPIAGVEFFTRRDDQWRRPGAALPCFDVPAEGAFRPLHQVLFPAPVKPVGMDGATTPGTRAPMRLRLLTDALPRTTSAMLAPARAWLAWAETVSTPCLAKIRAAASDTEVLGLGAPLPLLDGGIRLWGEQVLVPLGYRTEPALKPSLLRLALGVAGHELAIVWQDRAETVPQAAFAPMDRYGLRRLLERGA